VSVSGRIRRLSALVALLATGLWALPARASDEDAAARAYQQALREYAAGELAAALASMKQSYRLSERPELLYNIARIESELGHCSAALADYNEYLRQVRRGAYRREAEESAARLAAQCGPTSGEASVVGAAESAPAADAAGSQTSSKEAVTNAKTDGGPPAEEGGSETSNVFAPRPATPTADAHNAAERAETPRSYWTLARSLGWTAVALGAAAGGLAIHFHAGAVNARDRLQTSIDREAAGGAYTDWKLEDEQHRKEAQSAIFAAACGALIAGGALAVVFGGNARQRSTVTAQLSVNSSSLSGQLLHRF